jgi:hypothetical protein
MVRRLVVVHIDVANVLQDIVFGTQNRCQVLVCPGDWTDHERVSLDRCHMICPVLIDKSYSGHIVLVADALEDTDLNLLKETRESRHGRSTLLH